MIELDSDISKKMVKLKRAMAEGAGGKTLKRELSKRLRGIMQPLANEQKLRVLRLPSKGHVGPSMRQAVARQTKAATRWSGRQAGIQIIQRARSMPRGFNMAGRMFNRADGWNPRSLGGEVLHQQVRPAGWFDEPVGRESPQVRQQIVAALDETADRLASKIR